LQQIAKRVQADYGPAHRDTRKGVPELLVGEPFPQPVVEAMTALARLLDESSGDGRRTALLVAAVTVGTAVAEIEAGCPAREMVAGIRRAARQATAAAEQFAVRATARDELVRAAATASLGVPGLGPQMLEAFREVGKDGVIHVTALPPDPSAPAVRLTFEEGQRYPLAGRPDWLDNPSLDEPLVLVSTARLGEEALGALTAVCRQTGRPCLCLCAAVDETVLALARRNHRQRLATVVPVPGQGEPRRLELFRDLAVATGAPIVDPRVGPDVGRLTAEDLGGAERIVLEEDALAVHGGRRRAGQVEARVEHLRRRMEEAESEDEREWVAVRLALLVGRIAEFLVCGASEEQIGRLHDLTCSALHSTRALVAEGGLPGGGAAYLWCAGRIAAAAPQDAGARALAAGLEAPWRALVEQAGLETEEVFDTVRANRNVCPDVESQALVDWRRRGPLDAARVVKAVVGAAAETAACLVERVV
jgi:chaperonin GroEL